jgi:hypothetical protein
MSCVNINNSTVEKPKDPAQPPTNLEKTMCCSSMTARSAGRRSTLPPLEDYQIDIMIGDVPGSAQQLICSPSR